MRKSLAGLLLGTIGLFASPLSAKAQGTFLYDDFSSGTLNSSLWSVVQDTEGQPLTDEYGVSNENGNFAFHTQQNSAGDRRTYLLPNTTFTTGDIFSWDMNTLSHQGNYGGMVLLGGDQNIRIGINGYNGGVQGFDEIGTANISFTFNPNSLDIIRQSPSGNILYDSLPLNQANGNYSLRIGSFTGHNGSSHMDFDNFRTGVVPEPSTLALLGLGAAGLIAYRRKKN